MSINGLKFIDKSELENVMKEAGASSIATNIYPLIRRLVLSYLMYYIKQCNLLLEHTKSNTIELSDLQLIRRLNIETNAFNHGYYIEKIAHTMNLMGGGSATISVRQGELDLHQLGGNKYKLYSLDKILKNISKLNITVEAMILFRDITENYIQKLIFNTIEYNKEMKKSNPRHITTDSVINSLPFS